MARLEPAAAAGEAELGFLDAPLGAGARGGFSTRSGGQSRPPFDSLNLGGRVGDDPAAVAANRARLAARLGVSGIHFLHQVHGAAVAVLPAVPAADPAEPPDPADPAPPADPAVAGSDAVITGSVGVAVGVLAADCVPVLLHEPVAGLVAAVHAGRRGLVAGVLQATVASLVAAGGAPERLVAVIGPGVGGCCYEVPAELVAEVAAVVPGTASRTRTGRPSLDLPAGVRRVLADCGVGSVAEVAACTVDDRRFFSYRRDGVTGRFAGVVVRDPT